MPLIDTNKNSVLFKYGGVPTALDVVNIEENVMVKPNVDPKEYKELDGQLGSKKSYIDFEHITTSFSIKAKLRGNDKTGLAPETLPSISSLLKASGLSESIGLSDVKYTPNHSIITPSQAAVYMDGKKRLVDGIVCDFKLSGTVGECAIVEFNAQGYTDIADTDEANPTVVLDSEALMVVNKVQVVTIGGGTFNLKSFEFSLNNEIQDIYAIDLAQFERTDFDPKISLVGYRDSTDTAWVQLAAEELKTIEIVLGNEVGKSVTLKIDSAKPIDNSESDDSGKLSITREFRCTKDAISGNHFEIIWS
jgi:Phage tail tube protein